MFKRPLEHCSLITSRTERTKALRVCVFVLGKEIYFFFVFGFTLLQHIESAGGARKEN